MICFQISILLKRKKTFHHEALLFGSQDRTSNILTLENMGLNPQSLYCYLHLTNNFSCDLGTFYCFIRNLSILHLSEWFLESSLQKWLQWSGVNIFALTWCPFIYQWLCCLLVYWCKLYKHAEWRVEVRVCYNRKESCLMFRSRGWSYLKSTSWFVCWEYAHIYIRIL